MSPMQQRTQWPYAWRSRTTADGDGLSRRLASVWNTTDVNWRFLELEGEATAKLGFFSFPSLVVDQQDRIHLVLSPASAPEGYPLLGVLYTRSDDHGVTWTAPIQLGHEKEGQPAIAVYGDDVHVIWNGDAAKGGRYYRHSGDAGESWDPVEALSPPGSEGGEGLQNPPAITSIMLGKYMLYCTSRRICTMSARGEQDWSSKQRMFDPDLMLTREICHIRLAITGGNRLHAVYILSGSRRRLSQESYTTSIVRYLRRCHTASLAGDCRQPYTGRHRTARHRVPARQPLATAAYFGLICAAPSTPSRPDAPLTASAVAVLLLLSAVLGVHIARRQI